LGTYRRDLLALLNSPRSSHVSASACQQHACISPHLRRRFPEPGPLQQRTLRQACDAPWSRGSEHAPRCVPWPPPTVRLATLAAARPRLSRYLFV